MSDPGQPDETRSEAEFVIVGGWLAESVTGCTCGTGGTGYGHEAGCGLEPVAKIADLLAAEVERPMLQRELAAARAEVTRLRQAVEALAVEYEAHEGMFDATMDTRDHEIADRVLVGVARRLRTALAAASVCAPVTAPGPGPVTATPNHRIEGDENDESA